MSKKFLTVVFCLLTFLTFGCGRKGNLQEPVPRVPQTVMDFRAVQRGENLLFTWTAPGSSLRGDPLVISRVEIRGLEVRTEELSGKEARSYFVKYSRPVEELGIGQLDAGLDRAILKLDLKKIDGKSFLFGLRIRGPRSGWSDISNLVSVKTAILPCPPSSLRAEVSDQTVNLSWEPPTTDLDGRPLTENVYYFVYRSRAAEYLLLNKLPLSEPRVLDRDVPSGHTYKYLVRSAVVRDGEFRESSDSEILEVKVQDLVPPASPLEVKALIGDEGVAISWLPNQEKDLAGYRVYRMKEGDPGPILLTPENLTVPVFLDRSVEKNAGYVYSISSVDTSGNESPPTTIKVRI